MNYKIFIINLDRSVERYTHALAQLSAWPELPVERISAADGRLMSDTELNQYYAEDLNRQHFHKLLKAGEKGCYISHIRCWQQIVAQQLDFAIILEDDFILQADLPQLIASIQALATPYHYLKLAMPNKQQPVLTRQPMLNGFSLVDYKKMPVSTVAQVVSQQGAALLLAKAVPFYRPIDVQLQYSFELGIRAQGIQPQAVRPELEFESNIYSKHTDVVDRGLFYRNRVHFAWANFRHNVTQYGLSVTLNAST
jgi:glycosyl transferase family 25